MFFRADGPVYRFVAVEIIALRAYGPAFVRRLIKDCRNSALFRGGGGSRGAHDDKGHLQRLGNSERLRCDTETGRDSIASGDCIQSRLAIGRHRPSRHIRGQPGGRSGKELSCPTATGNSIAKQDWTGTQKARNGQHRCHSQDGFRDFVPTTSAHSHIDLQYSGHSPSCTHRTIAGRSSQIHPAIVQPKGLVGKPWQPPRAVGAPRGRRGGDRKCRFRRGKCRFCSAACQPLPGYS